jgi:hypothetical protein
MIKKLFNSFTVTKFNFILTLAMLVYHYVSYFVYHQGELGGSVVWVLLSMLWFNIYLAERSAKSKKS